jgi:hypothetical protein
MPKQLRRDRTRDLAEELDVFDTMLASLVELLEERGILTQEQWEERIRMKTVKAGGSKSYRDLQFASRKPERNQPKREALR